MTSWTDEQLLAQGYQLDPDPGLAERTALDRQIDRNAQNRESLMPSSRATGPLAPKEAAAPLSEVERLLRPGLAWQPGAKADPRLVRLEE